MRGREALAFAALSLLSPACRRAPVARCQPLPDKSVVACVGDDAVRRGEAQEFLRDPEWIPGSAKLPDAKSLAVDKAIATRLLAGEAKRRGLQPPAGVPSTPATLSRALLTDEAKKRNLNRDAISEEDAKKFYDEHPEAFGQLDEVTLQAVIVASGDKAEGVYREAKDADEAKFAALVTKYSEDEPSKKLRGVLPPIHASEGADRELLKLGLTLRRVGAIGGPVKAADGRYYVVRVLEAPIIRRPPFDEQSRAKAKNILVFERMRKVEEELVTALRGSAVIRRFDDAIAALEPAPEPESSPAPQPPSQPSH